MNAHDRLDLDRLTLDGVRAGALRDVPATVLGLARTGVALARFLVDAGARVTVYDGKPADALAEAVAGPSRGVRSPSPAGPTSTRPRLDGRGARRLQPLDHAGLPDDRAPPARGARRPGGPGRGRRARRPGAGVRAGPLPAPLPRADGRGDRDEGQDDHVVAGRAPPRRRPRPPGGPRREHRHAARSTASTSSRPTTASSTSSPSCSCPSLTRGTTVAVYTNVTADHLDRHGSLEAYRRVKRRLAELVDPDGALVLNLDDPVVAGVRRPGRDADGLLPPRAPDPGRPRDRGRVGRRGRRRAPAPRRRRRRRRRVPAAGSCRWASSPCPGRHNLSNLLAAIGVALLFGVAPDAIRRQAASFRGVEHRLELVAEIDGVRFVNDSQGTQPDAVAAALRSFDAPARPHRRRPRQGRRPGGPRPGRGGARRRRRPHRRERAGPGSLFRAAGVPLVEEAGTLDRRPAAGRRDRPRAARRPPRARSPRCCSRRRPRASTSSPTTPPAAAPSRTASRRSPRPAPRRDEEVTMGPTDRARPTGPPRLRPRPGRRARGVRPARAPARPGRERRPPRAPRPRRSPRRRA